MDGRCEKDTSSDINKQQSETQLPTIKNVSDKDLCSIFSLCKIKKGLFSDIVKIDSLGYDNIIEDIKKYRYDDYLRIHKSKHKIAEYIYYCVIKEMVVRFLKNNEMGYLNVERDLFCLQ